MRIRIDGTARETLHLQARCWDIQEAGKCHSCVLAELCNRITDVAAFCVVTEPRCDRRGTSILTGRKEV